MTRLLSLNELSRKADVPYPNVLTSVRTGELRPDAVSGRFLLFNENRLPELIVFLSRRWGRKELK